jgi:hypothetical protein
LPLRFLIEAIGNLTCECGHSVDGQISNDFLDTEGLIPK